ncbi:class V lanthionine synthetase subunit LxmK [Rathayibacter sp. AY1F6]|uniref:class V lanthionine synthetase subunit LxmK n=1 Tax=Rathayibacter sp. AY1F6 TaxID=2080560 RepID=UPI0021580006|nr:class V lanthionine synthetase subunit LxmK [Rathayibacter sp. AY1F6]
MTLLATPGLRPATPGHRPADPAALRAAASTERLLGGGRHRVAAIDRPAFAGRNASWTMTLDDGARVFVKHVSPRTAGPAAFRRSRDFAGFVARSPEHAPAGPRLLAADEDDSLLVFEHCPGTSLALLLVEERVPADFPEQAGRLLARLHAGPVAGLTATSHPSPPVEMLRVGIPHTRYVDLTLAELAFWGDLQHDEQLVSATEDLREWESGNRTAPIHGDLRLDQFHLRDGRLQLLDWEEFGIGDPARDLGTLAGEWIHRAVLDTVTTREGASAPPLAFDTAAADARIAERMAALVPRIRRMWLAYAAETAGADDALAVRATAHLGWHLVDRTLARASMVSRLPGIERAAAGIGRRVLLAPSAYSTALGFDRSPR